MALSIVDSRPHNLESVRAPSLFPSAIEESAKTLMDFIQVYYDHINSVGLPSYEIANITREKDIDLVSDKYLSEIQGLIARNIPNSRVLDKVSLYKIILQYYRTRGSEDSIHTFFKIFFDEAVNIFYPKDYLFDLSSGGGSWIDLEERLSTLNVVNTNPNKSRISITSDVAIAPPHPGTVAPYTFIFRSYSNTAWTLDGLAPASQPRVVRNGTNDRWVYLYEAYSIESVNDAVWPDGADWRSSFISNLTYNETAVADRNIQYDTLTITPIASGTVDLPTHGITTEVGGTAYITSEAGTADAFAIVTEAAFPATRVIVEQNVEYLHTFIVTAIPEFASRINDVLNRVPSTLANNAIEIYRASRLDPTVWELLQSSADGKYLIWQYTDARSFPSDRYKLHDGVFWQKYSYQIKSSLSLDTWSYDYLRFVHPSGLKLFAAILIQLVARTGWPEPIDYSAPRPQQDISWLNSYRPPVAGAHTPTSQPGWLSAALRIFNILSVASQTDEERAALQRLVYIFKKSFYQATAAYVIEGQNAFASNDSSLSLYYTYLNWAYSELFHDENVQDENYGDASLTLRFDGQTLAGYEYSAVAPRTNPNGATLYIENGVNVLVNESGDYTFVIESLGN
jgi:hypothetical protein